MPDFVELRPQFQQALWGGRKLAAMPGAPAEGPISEAWLVSDVVGRTSHVARGMYSDQLLHQLLPLIFGEPAPSMFPLLVKLIDAKLPLSVQVHPDDEKAQDLVGAPCGKTEAWVVLDAEPGSRIYAGLRDGVNRADVELALAEDRIVDVLHSFEPWVGDGVFLPAGTIHALGGGVTVFEVQQTSDITYRLSDWGRVDPVTGQPRELHVDQGLACINYYGGPVRPIRNAPLVIQCDYFDLRAHRHAVEVGGDGKCRVLAAFGGRTVGCVDVDPEAAVVLPASTGVCRLTPEPGSWLFEVVVS